LHRCILIKIYRCWSVRLIERYIENWKRDYKLISCSWHFQTSIISSIQNRQVFTAISRPNNSTSSKMLRIISSFNRKIKIFPLIKINFELYFRRARNEFIHLVQFPRTINSRMPRSLRDNRTISEFCAAICHVCRNIWVILFGVLSKENPCITWQHASTNREVHSSRGVAAL